jgi:CDP-diacylglycerol--serine O-phosphatidyltransferase
LSACRPRPVYTLAVAILLVSRLPVYSGKRFGTRVPPEMVGPVVIVVVLFVALLIAYPWIILTAGTLAYLVSLPFGYLSYRGYQERAREAKAETATPAPAAQASSIAATIARPSPGQDRPSRLN